MLTDWTELTLKPEHYNNGQPYLLYELNKIQQAYNFAITQIFVVNF